MLHVTRETRAIVYKQYAPNICLPWRKCLKSIEILCKILKEAVKKLIRSSISGSHSSFQDTLIQVFNLKIAKTGVLLKFYGTLPWFIVYIFCKLEHARLTIPNCFITLFPIILSFKSHKLVALFWAWIGGLKCHPKYLQMYKIKNVRNPC